MPHLPAKSKPFFDVLFGIRSWSHKEPRLELRYCFSVASGGLEQTLKVADKEARAHRAEACGHGLCGEGRMLWPNDGQVIGIVHHPSRNVIAGFSGDGTMSFMRA